jgi:hypothetical protein
MVAKVNSDWDPTTEHAIRPATDWLATIKVACNHCEMQYIVRHNCRAAFETYFPSLPDVVVSYNETVLQAVS